MDAIDRQPQPPQVDAPSVLDGYLTRETLASQLNKSVRTLDRWETRRIGPPRTVIAHTVLYRMEAVREWLESREQRRRSVVRRSRAR